MPFGAGIGLTFDEAALLLDLRDVYWTREGVLSVQLSLGVAATLGGTILALRMLRRGEERVEAAGRIPAVDWTEPVAREELAVLLQQPGELERPLQLGQAHRQARPLAAGELRRVGHEQLVDQARLDQLGVQARAALAEQRPDAALHPQVAKRRGEVDPPLVVDDPNRGRGSAGARRRRR